MNRHPSAKFCGETKGGLFLGGFLFVLNSVVAAPQAVELASLTSPVLLQGTNTLAFRDPAVTYHQGVFHLFYTYVQSAGEQRNVRMAIGVSLSSDLKNWTPTRLLTDPDPEFNFSSPGNVFRHDDTWLMCVSSYPRPNGEIYGNKDARIWIMRSQDLEHWSAPELLRVKGPDVTPAEMGRMIDPYLFQDKDMPNRWWCLFKQDGKVHRSWSHDLINWTYRGAIAEGENACVVVKDNLYYLFSAPKNGIALSSSPDGETWKSLGLLTLGQSDWAWASGRLTAGFVIDLHSDPSVKKYLMFFHGSGPDPEPTVFDTHASIGIAWSDDMESWEWPKKEDPHSDHPPRPNPQTRPCPQTQPLPPAPPNHPHGGRKPRSNKPTSDCPIQKSMQ